MLLSMACFAGMNIIIRQLSVSMHSTQMVFIRNGMSLCIVLVVAFFLARGVPEFRTKRLSGHFGRSTMGLIAMQLWFYSITLMPVTLVTALSFTTPIFSTIFAILFLKEHAGPRRWAAMLISFIGVLLILDPDFGHMNNKVLFVFASSAAMGVAGVFVKSLSRTESPETIVFYMTIFMTPLSLPLALMHWKPIMAEQLWSLLWIALLSTSAQLMMARAYQRAQLVVLMPLDFTRLIFTSLFAYITFGEVLDAQAWVGAMIIVASTAYIAHREAKRKSAINSTLASNLLETEPPRKCHVL